MEEVLVCKSDELSNGSTRIIYHGPHELAVIRYNNKFYAYSNICPHQGGPACEGILVPKVIDALDVEGQFVGQRYDENDMHIVCPWRGYEFHLENGEHVGIKKFKLKKYNVLERGGSIYVLI